MQGFPNHTNSSCVFRAGLILRQLDLVAVSVDGKQEVHDLMRGQQGAFTAMLEGLDVLKDSVEKLGVIHALLPDSWQILAWLTDFALKHKASLLHLHPLEHRCRAAENSRTGADTDFAERRLTPVDLYRVYIAHYYLQTFSEPDLFIRLDLLHRDNIIGNPNFFFHQIGGAGAFRELIINEAGDILPIAHGCSDFFRIGNISSGVPLEEMIECFISEKLDTVMQLYNATYREILADTEFEIFNWSERVVENSFCYTPRGSNIP